MMAFPPWDFPVSGVTSKISVTLATVSSIIVNLPEETSIAPNVLRDVFKDVTYQTACSISSIAIRLKSSVISCLISSSIGCCSPARCLSASISQYYRIVHKARQMELDGRVSLMMFNEIDIDHATVMPTGSKCRNTNQACCFTDVLSDPGGPL